ncbi:MAG: M18 family aminopeptidase [Lachnospiraceae bacterium]|nr:M18 family aminopeptidase [Lachnospiraceae bacterium]
MSTIKELNEFIKKSISPFHTACAAADEFRQSGFEELISGEKWNVKCGGKYFVKIYESSIAAFTIGENGIETGKLRIAAAHTDFPCFKVKPSASIMENGYHKLNTEVYGGAILNTWLDRPLSIAGRAAVRGKDCFSSESVMVDFAKPVLVIPNVAIHMNKSVNKGIELNSQKDMLPLADSIIKENMEKANLEERISELLHIPKKSILDYELYIYQYEQGEVTGFDNTLFSSPRLDNLTSVKACIDGITDADVRKEGINAVVFFDNEEVGSRTKQGAASNIFPMLLEKLYLSLGKSREDYINAVINGSIVSVDVAHALHPDSPEKNDITNKPVLNGGTVIKLAAGQTYANDAQSSALIRCLAEKSETKCQTFVNRSDMAGGSTLGAILSSVLPMRTIDIGIPLLAMHSARELMGVNDQESLKKLLTCYFT